MPETTRRLIVPSDVQSAVTLAEATALANLARGKTVLEMGAWHGFSTIVLASVAELVISVDWHQGDDHAGKQDTWATFENNLVRYGVADRVVVHKGRFEDELPKLAVAGLQVDGVFLDGMHDEASVSRDTGLALALIKPRGFIAWHDYGRSAATGNAGFEVTEVADRFGVSGRVESLAWGFVPQV